MSATRGRATEPPVAGTAVLPRLHPPRLRNSQQRKQYNAAAVWMRGATAEAVAEATFSTVGVKSFSRAEHVEHVDLAVSSLRRGATQPPVADTEAGSSILQDSEAPRNESNSVQSLVDSR